MKLTKDDKVYLKSLGHPEEDFEQIEEATKKTDYELEDKVKISRAKAIEILGRQVYLSGISRSAFHYSAVRFNEDDTISVYFDSRRLFG